MFRVAKFFVLIFIFTILEFNIVLAACDPPECNDPNEPDAKCASNETCSAKCCVSNTGGGGAVPTTPPSGGGGTTTTVAKPVNLNATCINGVINLTWENGGTKTIDSYDLKIDNPINSWTGSCTNINPGDYCLSTGTTSYSFVSELVSAVNGPYSWWLKANIGSKTSNRADGPNILCLKPNGPPTFSSIVLKNNLNTTVVLDKEGKNNICQRTFNKTNLVNVTIGASDPDGQADITDIQLRWNGIVFTRDSLLNGIANFSHTFTGAEYNSNVFDFQVNITDSKGVTTGWISTNRFFKVWDCIVPVSGTLFDGTDGQLCSTGTGFSVLADSDMNFSSINFKNLSSGSDVVGTATPPSSFGLNNLVWGETYLPLINGGDDYSNLEGDLVGSARMTRLIDTGVGTTICNGNSSINTVNDVSAYSLNPGLKIDLSYITDQGGWFQARGMDIKARVRITSEVPLMANSYLILDNTDIGSSNGGVVLAPIFENISGWSDNSQYGFPNNSPVKNSAVDKKKHDYNSIYKNYYLKHDVGTTGVTVINNGDTGLKFVNGDLIIYSDVVVPPNEYLMVVVKGKITIDVDATRVDGIYMADEGIDIVGESNNQLVINGVLFAAGKNSNIIFTRSFIDHSQNNNTPAVVVNYRPDMIFALPGKINRILTGFREL